MGKFIINGGNRLMGEIVIEGSKNAAIPILSATILNSDLNVIKNCPNMRDTLIMVEILQSIGCKVSREESTVIVDSSTANKTLVPFELAGVLRSSTILLGPILARFGKVSLSYPGGCEIGPRPIDLHLKALRCMGARINDAQRGIIYCEADRLKGCDIQLDYPSVGATENIIMAAIFAEGETIIKNAAKEPEIVDLQNYLHSVGAKMNGAGTSIIQIEGVKKLHSGEHTVIPDRIAAGTYMIGSAITGGDINIIHIVPEHINQIISILRECGCKIKTKADMLQIRSPERPKSIDIIRTLPFPGFPTDMQAQMIALLSIARGSSVVMETVFENRYKHVEDLIRMGASIKLEGRIAVIKGVNKIQGAEVYARDLRGGAALVLAGLAAEGETIVNEIMHIDRGYEFMEKKLTNVGAIIRRE